MIKYTVFILIVLPLNLSKCFDLNKEIRINDTELKCIEISQTFPQLSLEGKIIGYDTPKIHLFFFKNLAMYKIPYSFSEDDGIEDEKRSFYFIWQKGDSIGVRYNWGSHPPEKFKVDSTIKSFWPNEMELANSFKIKEFDITLISTKITKSSKVLEFSFKGDRDNISHSGKTILYYDTTFNNIDFSFSREMDTVKSMKLYKIINIEDAKFVPEYNFTFEPMETYYKIEEIKKFDKEEALKVFELFKNDIGSN